MFQNDFNFQANTLPGSSSDIYLTNNSFLMFESRFNRFNFGKEQQQMEHSRLLVNRYSHLVKSCPKVSHYSEDIRSRERNAFFISGNVSLYHT